MAGVHGPIQLSTPAIFAHVHLAPRATIRFAVDAGSEIPLYAMDGILAGAGDAPLVPSSLALLTKGDNVSLTNLSDEPADAAIFGGAPTEKPFLFAGPFVMGNESEVLRTKRAYASGEMGRLDGVPF